MSGSAAGQPSFAHASEAELARILDFYEVRWTYEPDTFPIGWSLDGDVVESFSPDFYLPDLELYVELTTLKQSLVRKKNRKLRRLRELYPDIRIKLFYARDFRALLLKFGRLALVDELTGSTGQSTPPRTRDEVPLVAATTDGDHPGDARIDAMPGVDGVARPAETRGRRRGRRRRRSAASIAAGAASSLAAAAAAAAGAAGSISGPGGLDIGPQPA